MRRLRVSGLLADRLDDVNMPDWDRKLAKAQLRFVEHTLEAAAREAFELHVHGCASCREALAHVIAVGATVLLDYSVFGAWGIAIRNATVGTWTTGFIVAGMTDQNDGAILARVTNGFTVNLGDQRTSGVNDL